MFNSTWTVLTRHGSGRAAQLHRELAVRRARLRPFWPLVRFYPACAWVRRASGCDRAHPSLAKILSFWPAMVVTGFAPSHPCPERPPQATPGGRPRAAENGSAVIIMPGGTRIELQDQPASYMVESATESATLVDALRGPAAFSPQGSTGSAASTARTTASKRRDRRKASAERARQERAANAAPSSASPVPQERSQVS